MTLVFLILICPGHAKNAEASSLDKIQVELPSFTIQINDLIIDNSRRKYPFIVSQNITYMPMTYHDSRFLGITADWSDDEGMVINSSDLISGAYIPAVQSNKNKQRDTAQIYAGSVRVNDKMFDQSREPYPLLVYRDVIYFPLTWRFAVEEFQWEYTFDEDAGLMINDYTHQDAYGLLDRVGEYSYWASRNITGRRGDDKYFVQISGKGRKEVILEGARDIIDVWKGYIYYTVDNKDNNRDLYRAVADGQNPQLMAQNIGEDFLAPTEKAIFTENGRDYLMLHPWKGNFGSSNVVDIYQLTDQDAQYIGTVGDNMTFAITDDWLFYQADGFQAEKIPNMNKVERHWFGDESHWLNGLNVIGSVACIGEELYVVGYYNDQPRDFLIHPYNDEAELYVYKINLENLEVQKMSDMQADSNGICFFDDQLIYHNEDGLYAMTLDGKNITQLAKQAVMRKLSIHAGSIYYLNEEFQLCRLNHEYTAEIVCATPIYAYEFLSNGQIKATLLKSSRTIVV